MADDILNVDGLAWKTTENKLRDYFQQYGEISNVTIDRNIPGGRSRTANFSGYIIFTNPADINRVPLNHIIDGRNVVTVGGQRLHAQVEIDGGNPQGAEEELQVEEPVQEPPCMKSEETQVQIDGGNSGGIEEEQKVEEPVQELPCMKSEETQVETDGEKSGCTEEEHKAEKSVQGLLISEETRVEIDGGNSGGIEEEHKVEESVQELPCMISKETQVEIDGGCNEERKSEKSVKGHLISEETQVETDGRNSDWTEEEHKVETSVQELPCMESEETQVQIDGGNSGCTEEEHKAEKSEILSEETRVGGNSGWTEEEHRVEKSGQGLPCMVSKETKQAEKPLPPWRIWVKKEETCFKPRKEFSPRKQAENVERARAAFARATERDNEIEDDDYANIRVASRDYPLPVDKSLLEKLAMKNLDDNKPLLERLKDWNDKPLLKQLNEEYIWLEKYKWD